MTTTPPIGLSGFAQSGKTTAANYLEAEYGYKRQHIADPLRDMLRSLLFDMGMSGADAHRYLEGAAKEEVIPCLGVTSRHAQVSLGTEWGRNQINPDLWVNAWKHRAASVDAPMNDSVRFPNEERVIRDMGGFTILIVRPDCTPAAFKGRLGRWLYETFGVMRGVHDSERTDRLSPDYVVHNTGTLRELHGMLDRVMWLHQDGVGGTTGPIVVRPDSL